MRSREELQSKFEEILGTSDVYFQPPPNIKMTYPAIVFRRKKIKPIFANNSVYITQTAYEATVIDKNPDSKIVEKVSKLPCCEHMRHFKADNLNHDVFTIY